MGLWTASKIRARRAKAGRRGATAVEFALIAVPFLAMMFALLEIMSIFFVQTTLEAAVQEEARKIRTGQAQSTTAPISRAQFKTSICNRMFGMGDCTNRLFVMVQRYTTAPTSMTLPWADGTLTPGDPNDEPYEGSDPGDIVVVRAYYVWPILTPGMMQVMGNYSSAALGTSNRMLVATSAFRNEPFR